MATPPWLRTHLTLRPDTKGCPAASRTVMATRGEARNGTDSPPKHTVHLARVA